MLVLSVALASALGGWGPEVPVAPQASGTYAAPGIKWNPAAAAWGDDFLVAWRDGRFADHRLVMVSRVSGDGGVLDPVGLVASGSTSSLPRLSTRGALAAVAWESREQGWLRLLRSDGTWLSQARRVGSRCPDVAVGTSSVVVVSEGGPIRGVRLDYDGGQIDATPVQLSSADVPWGTCARVRVDATGDTALVAWRDDNTGTLTTVSWPLSGAPAAPRAVAGGMGLGYIDLEPLGVDRWFIGAAWQPTPPGVEIVGYDVSAASQQPPIPLLASGAWLQVPLTPCTGGLCGVAVQDGANVTSSTLLAPLDGGAVTLGAAQQIGLSTWALTSSPDGQTLMAVLADYQRVITQPTRADFTPRAPPISVTRGGPTQLEPDVAVLAGVALVAWIEQTTDTTARVLVRRFDNTGAAIDPAPVVLNFPSGNWPSEVEVLTTTGAWVVVASDWGNERTWITWVSSGGVLGPVHVMSARGMHMGFAMAGEQLWVSAKQYQTAYWDPVLVRVRPDGGEETVRLQDTQPKEHYTDIAVNGRGEALAVWQDVDPQGTDGLVAGVRVAPDGTVRDVPALRLSPMGPEALDPQVVSDGDAGFIVAWRSYRAIYARHVVDGVGSTPVQLAAPELFDMPAHVNLVPFVYGALVSYANPRDGGVVTQTLRVAPGGLIAEYPATLSTPGLHGWPAVAMNGEVAWMAYGRANLTTNAMQVMLRTFSREGTGGACEAAWMCKSGDCEAGLCAAPPPPPDGGAAVDGGSTAGDGGSTGGDDGGGGDGDGGTTSGKRSLQVGCGCGAAPVESLAALLLLTLAARRQRARAV